MFHNAVILYDKLRFCIYLTVREPILSLIHDFPQLMFIAGVLTY